VSADRPLGGLAVFVAVQLLHLVGASLVAAFVLRLLLPNLAGAVLPLAALASVVPGVVLAGIAVTRGATSATSWVWRLVLAWLAAGVAAAAWLGGQQQALEPLLAVALLLLAAALALARGGPYQAMAEDFRQRRR
jgi:hypothetical protein